MNNINQNIISERKITQTVNDSSFFRILSTETVEYYKMPHQNMCMFT